MKMPSKIAIHCFSNSPIYNMIAPVILIACITGSLSLRYGQPQDRILVGREVGIIEEPKPYQFSYGTVDEVGNTQTRQEQGDEQGSVRGTYSYQNVDGIGRQVEYQADDLGFRALIRTTEPGTDNKNPADVQINSDPVESKSLYGNVQSGNYRSGLTNQQIGHDGARRQNLYRSTVDGTGLYDNRRIINSNVGQSSGYIRGRDHGNLRSGLVNQQIGHDGARRQNLYRSTVDGTRLYDNRRIVNSNVGQGSGYNRGRDHGNLRSGLVNQQIGHDGARRQNLYRSTVDGAGLYDNRRIVNSNVGQGSGYNRGRDHSGNSGLNYRNVRSSIVRSNSKGNAYLQ